MLERFFNYEGIALDIETKAISKKKKDALHFKRNQLICIAIAYKDDVISFDWETGPTDELADLLSKVKLIGHNLKFDLKNIYRNAPNKVADTYFDTAIAARLLNESDKHDLESCVLKYLKKEPWKLDYKAEHTVDEWRKHCEEDAKNTYALAEKFSDLLDLQNLKTLFRTEMEVQNVFTRAEIKGVPIDVDYLKKLQTKYDRHIKRIERIIYKLAGIELNINSTKQLANLLYNKYALTPIKVGKTGPSTDTGVLTKLAEGLNPNPLPAWVLKYRHWEMLGRHIEKLIGDSIDSKIYPTFNTIGTETGRFSCTEPNLQQIPSKTAESLAIRKGFIGPMVVFDFSNVELRLLAHFTRDPELVKVYSPGGNGDLHETTAKLLGISRGQAKTINFGISYGMGPKKLAESLKISEDEARQMLAEWFRLYKFVNPWKKLVIQTIKKYGFIRSIGGRKRRMDYYSLPIKAQWGAEREAVNFTIQGSSADITKAAIVALKDEDIRMQVHDEIVIYNPKRSVEEIKRISESVYQLKVPLIVDCKACQNWSEMKD